MPLYASFLRDSVADLALKAGMAVDNEAKNHREVSEAYEMVANFEFYSGKYNDAAFNYEEAFFHRHFFPADRENPMLCLMAAVCYYHMNNFAKAYTVFERTVEQARLADAKDLECIALSNMAVLENCMLRSKAAIDKSTEALTLVNELPLTHPELDNDKYAMEHKRIYVAIMIRSGNYGQAELSIKEFQFSEKETAVLLAGCKFLSGQFESAKIVLEACSGRINEDGSMKAVEPKLKRHSSNMYEKTDADINEEEQCMFAALVSYNLAVVYGTSGRFEESIPLYNKAINILSKICILPNESPSKSELANKFKVHSSTKYLIFNIQRHLDAVSIESILGPAVLLSQCIAARAEATFLSSDLPGATNIQLGKVLPSDKKGSLSETELLSNELNDSFRSYLDAHPNLNVSISPADMNSKTQTPLNLKRVQSRRGGKDIVTMTTALIPQGTAGVDSCPDLIRAQEVLGPFRRLLGACSGGDSATSVTTETINTMKVLRHAGRATASKKPPGSAAVAAPASGFVLPRLSSADRMLEPSEESTTRAPGFDSALNLMPKCSNSVRATSLIVPETFQPRSLTALPDVGAARTGSRKDGKARGQDPDQYTAAVVEWALMICEGASLGMLGVPMVTLPKDYSDRRRDKERDRIRAEAKGAREKLQECLNNQKPSNPSVLMSVYSTLAKLCMHLGLRSDAGNHVSMFEELAKTINQRRTIALAKKFRVDYEEWLADATTPATTPSQTRLKRIQALLTHVKSYYAVAKSCRDNNFHRDACKRLMNIFIDISNIPDPLGTPPRDMGTVEELSLFTSAQIEEFEANDILWMKLYSKARAILFMRELKKIGAEESPPDADDDPIENIESGDGDTSENQDTSKQTGEEDDGAEKIELSAPLLEASSPMTASKTFDSDNSIGENCGEEDSHDVVVDEGKIGVEDV